MKLSYLNIGLRALSAKVFEYIISGVQRRRGIPAIFTGLELTLGF